MSKIFKNKILPKDVEELIDFGISGDNGASIYASMARLQSEGVAALYNILCGQKFAYLADEVGMGKTYQALGLAAILWNQKPDARIVFISPRANLQKKWIRDYYNFVANNYRRPLGNSGDDILKCALRGEPLIEAFCSENLRAFSSSLFTPGRKAWFLRHTSFRRPLFVSVSNVSELPEQWETCRKKLQSCGLHHHSEKLNIEKVSDASLAFNKEFGRALGYLLELLGDGNPAIDLLVVDEAQCLRHPHNQGNSVFREVFSNTVSKWLFLSATPVHRAPSDVQNQINEYVEPGFITDEDVEVPERLTKRMKSFLVRRPRKYVSPNNGLEWSKDQYRKHERKPVKSDKPISALAMALVQKKLAQLLGDRNNRYRIGFLSSFESLQESIKNNESIEDVESDTDFYTAGDQGPGDETDRKPIDWDFVSSLDRRFKSKFGQERFLPHAKMDETVDLLSEDAFLGNQKFLVFCRRIRAVEELRKRLDARWHRWVEKRAREVWSMNLDWHNPPEIIEGDDEDPEADIETPVAVDDDIGFRHASKKGEWLYKYRQTFRGAGKNAILFQENWLRLICELTGSDFTEVLKAIPSGLMNRALSESTREYGGRSRLYPADFLSRMVTLLVTEAPQLLGLDSDMQVTWQRFLTTICPSPVRRVASSARLVRPDTSILENKGFWEYWRERFSSPSDSMYLGVRRDFSLERLFRREIVKTCIWQSIRLTDMLIDFYFADHKAGGDRAGTLENYFDYFIGATSYARIARERAAGWIEHASVILLNCFRPDTDKFDLGVMAAKGSFAELDKPTAVVGISGGSNVNETAIRQFKTPSYPQIIVCTDVLKEGEDLHVFCDQVVHYGVAWTSGDLEQRIGRVDRYFSKIERRLCATDDSEAVKLNVLYPYLEDTLEKQQIELVLGRVRMAEKILDNFEFTSTLEGKEVYLDHDSRSQNLPKPLQSTSIHPFADVSGHLKGAGSRVVHTGRDYAQNLAQTLGSGLCRAIDQGRLVQCDLSDQRRFEFSLEQDNGERAHFSAEWQFVHEYLGYALRIKEPRTKEDLNEENFSFAYERQAENQRYQLYRTHKVILSRTPTIDEAAISIEQVLSYLSRDHVSIETDRSRLSAIQKKMEAIEELERFSWDRDKPHKSRLEFQFSFTHQTASLYVYRNMILVVSPVARIHDLDDNRFGNPDERRERVMDWVLDENKNLSLGFLHLNQDGELNLCERLFTDNVADKDFKIIVKALVHRADVYEAYLTGMDIH